MKHLSHKFGFNGDQRCQQLKNSAKKLHSGREWHEYQISALVERGSEQFLECVYTQHLPLYSDFRAISANGGGGEINF